ncbi:hypothetical protein P7K49_002230 [Saguinus oedipus]|uniref:Uncharacterized protein n=1 Tax=Saguinus oedipus TaxID=9490 RepID=A0ABQ9WGT8_SAGOE|nr:hypothetical protein P7K49_002230 [Saguinus oedipus]
MGLLGPMGRGAVASKGGSDLQSSHCTLDEAFEDLDWDTEKGLEAVACDTEGFVPPKVMHSWCRPESLASSVRDHAASSGCLGERVSQCCTLGLPGSQNVASWQLPQPLHFWMGLGLLSSSLSPQLISSKVPKAEYIPTIIRRDDPSIIPILYVSPAPESTPHRCPSAAPPQASAGTPGPQHAVGLLALTRP